MELKFTNAERKSINNGSISDSAASKIENKLPGFIIGKNPYQPVINFTRNLYGWDHDMSNPVQEELKTPAEIIGAKENDEGDKKFSGSNFDKKILQGSGYVVTDDPYTNNPNLRPPKQNRIRNIDIRLGFGGAVNTLNNFIQASNDHTTYDDFLASTKYDKGNIGGIDYIKESINDKAKSFKCGKMPKFSKGYVLSGIGAGASAGAMAGPVGAAIGAGIGGLLGGIGESLAENQEMYDYNKAVEKARLNTIKNRNGAITQYQRLLNAQKYGLQEDQFFGAKDGKIPEYSIGKPPVFTSKGFTTGEEQNAWVSGQEGVMDEYGNISIAPGPADLEDDIPAHIRKSDTVFRVQDMKYIRKTGDVQGALANLALSKKYKYGKMPKFAEGWLGNFIPSAMGTLASLNQTLSAYRNNVYRPNTYASNPYETNALTTLAGLRVNPYPIINQLRSAEARTNRAIDIAGGLSGGQRTAARLANLNTTQNNIANLLGNIQTQNNAYRTTYAKAALEAGQQARTARMQANQWDLDMYAKAHAARNKGIQTGIANMLSQIQQYQANEFKRRQFNDTMDLYRADQKQRAELNAWVRNNYGTRGVGIDPAYDNPTSTLYGSNNPFQSYMDKLNYSKNNWEKEMLKKYPYLNRYNPYN